MDLTIHSALLQGNLTCIPSKSQAHRLMICAAFADGPTTLLCSAVNRDMDATAACLRALGAEIIRQETGYRIHPIRHVPAEAVLPCGESGSTLRFLLPVAAALGVSTTFVLEGRLPQRPLSPLWEELERMGCQLSRPTPNTVRCTGQLQSGSFSIAGNVSSQFISGLLFAAALLPGDSRITVTGKPESVPYIAMTQKALADFGVNTQHYAVSGGQRFRSPGTVTVEGDWSNAAFFLAANALGSQLALQGLSDTSVQGDRAIAALLANMPDTIPAEDIPDLVPILSVVAAAGSGAVFTGIRRLRLKESDRIATTVQMLGALGIRAEAAENTLTVYPGIFQCGTVDSANDHRIAMSAAIAATVAQGPVTILGAQCVEKSYPLFWEEYARLGGHYEQYIR